MTGKLFEELSPLNPGIDLVDLDVSEWLPGIYFKHLEQEGKLVFKKVIKK